MRIQLSLEQNSLHFYGEGATDLRAAVTDTLLFVFPVMTLDYTTSGKLHVRQNGITQSYSLASGQASVPVSSLIGGSFVISASSDLYSTNEMVFNLSVTYSGNEMSPIANKQVYLNENQINIYNEDRSQFINFIMPRYYDGVDMSTKTCRIHWYSPENNVADYDAAQNMQVIGDNITFTWLVKNSLTQYVGEIQFVIEFIGQDYVWKTKLCTFDVLESLSDTGGLTPAPTDQWYETFVITMEGMIEDAEAWANGTRDGVDVGSTDPAYHKNAKYWSGVAEDEADRAESEADRAEAVVDGKAEVNGNYPEMTDGTALQLLSVAYQEEQVPYNYREAGGDLTGIGDRKDEVLVGGSLVWNQLVSPGNIRETRTINNVQFTNNNDGSITLNGTANGTVGGGEWRLADGIVISGHVYICTIVDDDSKAQYRIYNTTYVPQQGNIAITSGKTYNLTFYPQLFDLTAMFGSTIADYIYNLEQTTAGAGVAWFKKLFPKDYYAYDAGGLQSVKASEHRTVGFNLWDEEWENGYFGYSSSNMGQPTDGTTVRSKNFIRVVPGKTYFMKPPYSGTTYIWFYDSNKRGISLTNINVTGYKFTVPDNIYFIKFALEPVYGTTYNHDICINFSKTTGSPKNEDYVPYDGHSYPTGSDELRGIMKLDSNNKLYYDGDMKYPDGKILRRFGILDLGELSWSDVGQDHTISRNISEIAKTPGANNILFNAVSSYYSIIKRSDYVDTMDKVAFVNDGGYFIIKDSALTVGMTQGQRQAYLAGKYLVYPLKTPTIEQSTPFPSPQIVSPYGTEEYVDAGVAATPPTRDVAIPVGHVSKYHLDLRKKLEEMLELPDTPTTNGNYRLKATVQNGTAVLSWESEG